MLAWWTQKWERMAKTPEWPCLVSGWFIRTSQMGLAPCSFLMMNLYVALSAHRLIILWYWRGHQRNSGTPAESSLPPNRLTGHEFSTGQARSRLITHATIEVPFQHGWRNHFTWVFYHFRLLKYSRISGAPDEVPVLCFIFSKEKFCPEKLTWSVLHQIKFKFESAYLIYLISQPLFCQCF